MHILLYYRDSNILAHGCELLLTWACRQEQKKATASLRILDMDRKK